MKLVAVTAGASSVLFLVGLWWHFVCEPCLKLG